LIKSLARGIFCFTEAPKEACFRKALKEKQNNPKGLIKLL
jgi:hypothetical protein